MAKIQTPVSMLTLASRKRILLAALFTPIGKGRWGLPVILWGPPSSTKSAILDELTAECGLARISHRSRDSSRLLKKP